jgi:hypothetical protein
MRRPGLKWWGFEPHGRRGLVRKSLDRFGPIGGQEVSHAVVESTTHDVTPDPELRAEIPRSSRLRRLYALRHVFCVKGAVNEGHGDTNSAATPHCFQGITSMKRVLLTLATTVILAGSTHLVSAAGPPANKQNPAVAARQHPNQFFRGGMRTVPTAPIVYPGTVIYPPYTGGLGSSVYYGGGSNYGGLNYGYNRPVVYGNPANSFAPAGAFGFGPGAIFGW